MPDINPVYVFLALIGLSAAMFAEGFYLLFYNKASYRKNINRRLKVLDGKTDRESVLVQLRRERGLTESGDYRLPFININQLLLQSGLTIGFGKLVMFAGLAMVAGFVGMMMFDGQMPHALLVALFSGLVLPVLVLKFLRRRRRKKFGAQFPDAIDIIVRSLRAGHPVPVAINMVAREMSDPIGTEFGIVADEITYGADLETAMRNLAYRVGQEDLPLFVTAVAIQGATGGNLSEILENLSRVIRERFKMRRKVKALASEGKFSALFLSGLPIAIFIMIRYVAPDFYGSVWKYDITKFGLGMAATWMAMGNIVMYRMVNFR